jgi:hypothetical protein
MIAYQIQDSALIKVLKNVYITGMNLYLIRYKNNTTWLKKTLFILLLPLLSFLKISRIIVRNLRFNNTTGKFITLILIPGLYFCGLLWALGFYKALLFNADMSNQR